jgi:hypothetical protein
MTLVSSSGSSTIVITGTDIIPKEGDIGKAPYS